MTDIYLIRHGQSEANLSARYGTDAPLSKEGMRQAEVASKKMNIHPDFVISGTKIRQIQTAEIMFPHIYEHQKERVFDEIDFGELENTPISQKQNLKITLDVSSIKTVYKGDDIWLRAEKAIRYIKKLGKKYPERNIAIVTSETLMQSIVCLLLHGIRDGYIWTTKSHLRNCESVKLVVNDNAIDFNGKRCCQIDRLYIRGKNLLRIPAWTSALPEFKTESR